MLILSDDRLGRSKNHHVDIDAFHAFVEQRDNAHLPDTPVAVGYGATRRRHGSKLRSANFRSALGDAVDYGVDRRSSPTAQLKAHEVSGDGDLAMERFADDR